MNRLSLIAAVAVIAVALVGGAYLLTAGGRGLPAATLTPTATAAAVAPTVVPTATRDAVVPFPTEIWGDWHGPAVTLPVVAADPQHLRLSLNWDGGLTGWIQLEDAGRLVVQSSSKSAPAGEIRVTADVGATGCKFGDEGRYRWDRSPDGLFLTLQLIEDLCEARAIAFARTWVHSLSAVNDGGVGLIPADPWIQVTLPKARFAMSGGTDAADIHTFNDSEPFRGLLQLQDPMGFRAPCATANKPFAITSNVAAFETYLGTLPGLQLATSDTKVDGISGRRFEGVAVADPTCAQADRWLFRSRVPTETDAAWSYQVGDVFTIWAVVRNGHLNVFSWDGDGATVAEGQAIIDSIKFLDTLPTP